MSTVYSLNEKAFAKRRAGGRQGLAVLEIVFRVWDALSLLVGGVLASAIVGHADGGRLEDFSVSGFTMLLAALYALNVFGILGLYQQSNLGTLNLQVPRTLAGMGITFAAVVATIFLIYPPALPDRGWLVAWMAISLSAVLTSRVAARIFVDGLRSRGELAVRVLLMTSGVWGRTVRERLGAHDEGVRLSGCIDLDYVQASDSELASTLRRRIAGAGIDHVLVALPKDRDHELSRLVSILRDFPVEVAVAPEWSAPDVPVVGYRRLGDVDAMMCLEKPIDGLSWAIKNVFDRAVALSLLVGLAPMLLVIAVAVKFSSPGPILFRQKRFGFNQQMFEVYKFRTMYVDLCDANQSKTVKQATRDDPRVTPTGRFLRRSSFDELPQLLNVLFGSMSLVGPRPHAIAHDEYYGALIDGYVGRHRAKPGITGWAQVNGYRGEIRTIDDMRRRVEFDLHYIDNWSLWFDLRILFRTVFVCFTDDKAY